MTILEKARSDEVRFCEDCAAATDKAVSCSGRDWTGLDSGPRLR